MKFTNAFSIVLFLFASLFSFAQNPTQISGKVIDEVTGAGLAFVNIGIEGTLIGTASNSFGEFTLKIPEELNDKNVYFSAIGYQNYIVPLNTLSNGAIIRLQELSYGIDDVEISTQSKVLYRIIREAAEGIEKNFIQEPFSYKLLYRSETYTNQTLGQKRDAIVRLTDSKGYRNSASAFANRNYKFENVNRNFEVKSLADGSTLMDDLLMFDFARSTGNILEIGHLNSYDLESLSDAEINGETVLVIAYRLSNPDLTKTGDLYGTSSEGKLYITKASKQLLKVEANIKASTNSTLGRNIATDKTKSGNVKYHVTTTYKKTNKGFALDQISLNKTFLNEKQENVRIDASLLMLEVGEENKSITTRQYYEGMISDPDFWTTQGVTE